VGFIDRLDGAITQARASHAAQKEAARFAATVKPGQTLYSVVELNLAWGPSRALMEWTFTDRRAPVTGQYMCGHMSAAQVWLSYGPIHATRPPRLKTLDELRRAPQFPPDAAEALDAMQIVPAGV
jgi:hypothetical protein